MLLCFWSQNDLVSSTSWICVMLNYVMTVCVTNSLAFFPKIASIPKYCHHNISLACLFVPSEVIQFIISFWTFHVPSFDPYYSHNLKCQWYRSPPHTLNVPVLGCCSMKLILLEIGQQCYASMHTNGWAIMHSIMLRVRSLLFNQSSQSWVHVPDNCICQCRSLILHGTPFIFNK